MEAAHESLRDVDYPNGAHQRGAGRLCDLPPENAATDLKAIAGQWIGWLSLPGGARFDATNTIREDGTYENVIAGAGRFAGRVTVQDGKYRWTSEATGRTGTYILHEGGGRRVLISRADDGGYGEYTAAK